MMRKRYVTPEYIARLQFEFYDIQQEPRESPYDLASHLEDAAPCGKFTNTDEVMHLAFLWALKPTFRNHI